MSASIDIVLIDGGNDVSSSFASPGAAPSRTTSPATDYHAREARENSTRQQGREKKETSAAESVKTIASVIAKAMGAGALFDSAMKLNKAFRDVYESVLNLDRHLNKPITADRAGPTTVESSPDRAAKPTAKARASRKAEPADDFIEGEFEYASRKESAPGPASAERGLTVPKAVDAMTSRSQVATKVVAGEIEGSGGALAARGAAGAASGGAQAARGLAAVASAAGPLAIGLGVVTVAVAAGAIALKALFDTLSNEVKRLENVSADVNVAASMTEVRREMADLRRAEKIGPDLARFENVRSKLEDKTADLWTEVLKVLLKIFEVIEPAIEVVTDGIGVVTAGMEGVNVDLEIISDTLTGNFADMPQNFRDKTDAQNKLLKAIATLLTDQKDEPADAEDPFMNAFLANFAGGGQL